MPRTAILGPASIPSWFTFVINALDWFGRGSDAMTLFSLLTSKGALLIAFVWLLALAFAPDKLRSWVGDWLTRHGWRGEPPPDPAAQQVLEEKEKQLAKETLARVQAEDDLKLVKQDLALCDDSRKKEAQQLQSREYELEQCKLNLEMVKNERDSFKATADWRLKQNFAETLWYRSHDLRPKNFTVLIRYPDSNYLELAERFERVIKGVASHHIAVPWVLSDIEPSTGALKNPTDRSSIVLFTKDDDRDHLASALSGLAELADGNKIKAWEARDGQKHDLELVIFARKKQVD